MDVRALRYFIEVVRQNGFTRAAEALHVTQPTISKMVKALEDEFGGQLLLFMQRVQNLFHDLIDQIIIINSTDDGWK